VSGPLLEAIVSDLEVFSRYTRVQVDVFGSLLAIFEGEHGGGNLFVWAPRPAAAAVLRRLPRRFRGRIVLGLDSSPGDLLPFTHALNAAAADAVLLVAGEHGFFHAGGGWKEVAGGSGPVTVAFDDPAPALEIERVAPTGLRYRELRAYPAWNAPPLDGSTSGSAAAQGQAARARGLNVYAAGVLELERAWSPLLANLGALAAG